MLRREVVPVPLPSTRSLTGNTDAGQNRETALLNSVCDAHEVNTVRGRSSIKEGHTEVEGVLCPGGTDLPSGQAFFPRWATSRACAQLRGPGVCAVMETGGVYTHIIPPMEGCCHASSEHSGHSQARGTHLTTGPGVPDSAALVCRLSRQAARSQRPPASLSLEVPRVWTQGLIWTTAELKSSHGVVTRAGMPGSQPS